MFGFEFWLSLKLGDHGPVTKAVSLLTAASGFSSARGGQ